MKRKMKMKGKAAKGKATKRRLLKKKIRKPYPDESLFDYKNVEFLREFITEKGKIAPRKISGLHVKDQRKLAKVIKRARHAGMIPFVIQ